MANPCVFYFVSFTHLLRVTVVEERDGVVEVCDVVVGVYGDGLLVRRAGVGEVLQPREGDGQEHVARRVVRLEVDARVEVAEGRCVLAAIQVHEAEVVADDPLEGVQVQRTLEARDRRNVRQKLCVFNS